MSRLIDADKLMKKLGFIRELERQIYGQESYGFALKCIREVQDAPTIEERKTGKWLEFTNTNHTYVCSVCGRMLVNITDGKNTVTKNYPFCHCGADMRGEHNALDR